LFLKSAARIADPKDSLEFDTFRRATLRSERFRILTVLGVLAIWTIIFVIRSQRESTHGALSAIVGGVIIVACAALYEGFMLILAIRAERANRPIGFWAWTLNTIVECCLPTATLLSMTNDPNFGPYVALGTHVTVSYSFFIILSTLRLNPFFCILAGVASGGGYLVVLQYTRLKFPNSPFGGVMPVEVFILYPMMLLSAGAIASAVAVQLRNHVFAALHAAETQRKLDRMNYDMGVARSIQMGLLPKTSPKVSGYQIAGWNKPADQTGGDYYDWIELPDGAIILTIADASGHGVGPALLAAACRAYFRAVIAHGDPLERITEQVDALIAEDVSGGRFITAAIVLLEPHAHRLSIYSAGHAPTYHYVARTDHVLMLGADQPPLGFRVANDGSVAQRIDLAPGDMLVLVTDGFFECRNNNGEMLGMPRLGDAIKLHQSLPAADLIKQLHEDLLHFSRGAPQADDLTAVVIKRQSEPEDQKGSVVRF
jgi:serine phosphatase RsbU (regulator of sigma subunit)